jgi:hypothetical protein
MRLASRSEKTALVKLVKLVTFTGSSHSNYTNPYPEHIEDGVRSVFLDDRAPGKHNRVGCIESPDKEERATRSEPADQRKAEDPHQHADHFDYP